jgi:hypothetical protein
MMLIEEALTYHLENDADVAALVADRIYPNVIPQDVSLPALAYQKISRPGAMAHDGAVGIAWPRFQITGQADDYGVLANLIDSVEDSLNGFSGLMGGIGGVLIEGAFVKDVHDRYEFPTERKTRRLDVVIHYNVSNYYSKILATESADLILYHPMNEASGLVALDWSDQVNNGAYTGVDLGQQGIGDGLTCPYFDGVNDYNDIYSVGLNGDFNGAEGTLSIWFKPTAAFLAGVWDSAAFTIGVDASNVIQFAKGGAGELYSKYLAGGTTEDQIIVYSLGEIWNHWAITWSKSVDEVKHYLNGSQIGDTDTSLGVWAGSLNNALCTIGSDSNVPDNPANIYLAHGVIWKKALTGSQIANLAVL